MLTVCEPRILEVGQTSRCDAVVCYTVIHTGICMCLHIIHICSIEHLHQEASLAIPMMHSAVWLCGGRCVDEGAVVGAETIANNIILYILKIVNIM